MKKLLVGFVMLVSVGCVKSAPLVGTTPVPTPNVGASVAQAVQPPGFMDGYFTTAKSHAVWDSGSTQIILPSWGDPIAEAAADMQARHVYAFVSVHHCFGPGRSDTAACLHQTHEWAAPAIAAGRVVGVYGPDEPMGGEIKGVTLAYIDSFIAQVRAEFPGFPIMMAEVYMSWQRDYAPVHYFPQVEYFGLTAYYIGNPDWLVDYVRSEPRINMVFASTAPAGGYDWDGLAHRVGARGIMRWSLDLGAAGHTNLMPRIGK